MKAPLRKRRSRGATSAEWIMVVGIIALPFAWATVGLLHKVAFYYWYLERMNGLPLP